MRANSSHSPDHETQIRPLVGLSPAEDQQAWERAVQRSAGREVTARLVKNAVKALGFSTAPKPVSLRVKEARKTKTEHQRSLEQGIGELLVLLSQKVSYETLTQKVEAIHHHLQALFQKPS